MNMNTTTNNSIQQDEDEEEYEYEYSTTDTEDFYFTLDLTTHVPGALAPRPPARSGNGVDPLPDASNRGSNAGDDADQDNPTTNNTSTADETNPTTEKTPSTSPSDTLQILDLHTPNPLLKFNNETFTAHWSTDLGTQFHITQTGLHPSPLRRGNVLDVVALSQTRLLAKPITLNPRSHPHGPALNPSTTAKLPARKLVPVVPTTGLNDHPSSDDDDDEEAQPTRKSSTPGGLPSSSSSTTTPQSSSQIIARPGLPLYIPPSYRSSPSAATQATFLTRLSTIKLRKGEPDLVPVYAVKIYHPPPHAASLRASALAADEAAGHDVTVARMLDRSTGSRVDDGTGRREMRRQREGTLQEAKRRVRAQGTRRKKKERVGEGGEVVVGFGSGRGAGRASRERIRREVGFEEDGDVVRRDGMGRVERVHSGFRMRDGEQVLGLQRGRREGGEGDVEMVEVDDDEDEDGDGDEDVEMGEEEGGGGGSSARGSSARV